MYSRRGSQVVEFAMILPVFLALVFGSIDFTWYILQRYSVTDAVASGCRTGALSGRDKDADPPWVAGMAIENNLASVAMLNCQQNNCSIEIGEGISPGTDNKQLECSANLTVRPLSGFVPVIPTRISSVSTWPVEMPLRQDSDTGI
jgi:Flp pilus assembly protein TadG